MVIVATYLLFIAGSVVLCRLLQKSKRYYYKTNHFVSVSSMVYRMKRNGAGLASICILSTMVLVMISSTMCLYIGTEDTLRTRYPRNIIVKTDSLDTAYIDTVHGAVEEVLEKSGQKAENLLHYRYLDAAVYLAENRILFEAPASEDVQFSLYENIWQLFVLPLEDYNRLTGQRKRFARTRCFCMLQNQPLPGIRLRLVRSLRDRQKSFRSLQTSEWRSRCRRRRCI